MQTRRTVHVPHAGGAHPRTHIITHLTITAPLLQTNGNAAFVSVAGALPIYLTSNVASQAGSALWQGMFLADAWSVNARFKMDLLSGGGADGMAGHLCDDRRHGAGVTGKRRRQPRLWRHRPVGGCRARQGGTRTLFGYG